MSMVGKRGRPRHDDKLTPAEWRIAHAVRHGMSNAEIARRRGISADAVKFHLRNILGKLGLKDRQALRLWGGAPKSSGLQTGDAEMTDTGLGAIGQIARTVADVEKAEAWYRDVLGLDHLFSAGGMAFFDCDGTRLMLSPQRDGAPSESILYFAVPDVHAAMNGLKERGAEIISAAHMTHRHEDGSEEWMGFFHDNEGRPLGLMSRVKPKA